MTTFESHLRDIRSTDLYREVAQLWVDIRRPGAGAISDAAQMDTSPDHRTVIYAATIAEQPETEPVTRLAITDLASGETTTLTTGPHNDRAPRYSPDGMQVAFLSDRDEAGRFQLYLLDLQSGLVRPCQRVNGTVEQIEWSPTGCCILIVAVGSDHPGSLDLPSWMPQIDPMEGQDERRHCWTFDPINNLLAPIRSPDCAFWAAAWRGVGNLVTLFSNGPGENHWYSAELGLLDIRSGQQRSIYRPVGQLSAPSVSPDGTRVAVIEGLCSDRGPVLGDLLLIDIESGTHRVADTCGIDIQIAAWQSARHLLVSGFRGLETVVGIVDTEVPGFRELWSSTRRSITAACCRPLDQVGDAVLILEGFDAAPHIGTLRNGEFRALTVFDCGYGSYSQHIGRIEPLSWQSVHGLEIQGWFLQPQGNGPFPLVIDIHGGPIGHWRPAFLARRLLHALMLLRRGFAILLPNPRGSSGRGQAFVRHVLGDLGGADAQDVLTGLDHLIEQGAVEPKRIGITGVSYGGFMSAWLVTQSDRFSAAVPVSPHTNQLTAQHLSYIPGFMARLIGDEVGNSDGHYYDRSPIFHINGPRAPTLTIYGGRDQCTPSAEAIQFHAALREAGSPSVLVGYALEGHGVRRVPASLDWATRLIAWFEAFV